MFFKKSSTETKNTFLVKTCALLIHAAKIDQNYTENEEEIIKKTLLELGAKKETITQTIKNSGKNNIMVSKIPITYQYRKGKNEVDIDKFENYFSDGHNYTQRGTEYLIMAQ